MLILEERVVKAEHELEQMRLTLQEKVKEVERLNIESAKLTFNFEQQKAELDRTKQDNMTKDINLRGYTELAELNNEMQARNIEMVGKINNLQGKLDLIE